MKFTLKRLFASIMAVVLIINVGGVNANAEGDDGETEVVEVMEEVMETTEGMVEEVPEYIPEETVETANEEFYEETQEVIEAPEEIPTEEVTDPSKEVITEETVEEVEEVEEIIEVEETNGDELDEEEPEEVEEEEVFEKNVYEYDDAYMHVTATLDYADAMPDSAQLYVFEVGDADLYLQALNTNSDSFEYTLSNTVLYDIVFMAEEKDANGKVIPGQWVETEVSKGSVQLDVQFKDAQLSKGLAIENATDVKVIQMPLIGNMNKPSSAFDIAFNDLTFKSNVSLGSIDTISVSSDSTSVFAFANGAVVEEEAEEESEEDDQEEIPTKTVYEYEDANIRVTATFDYAEDMPDDAEFTVTAVEATDAYLEMLNAQNEIEDFEYTADNTMLFDFEFMAEEETDEDADETTEAQMVVYQPEEGSVKYEIEFKNAQISEDLAAEDADDVKVFAIDNAAEELNATVTLGAMDTVTATVDEAGVMAIANAKAEEVRIKRVYTYEDAKVRVTATLQFAEAVPDNAEFVVTELSGSIRDTYMEALNANAEEIAANSAQEEAMTYDDSNTLLYDVAFMVDAKDEDGKVIEGKKVEYQPEEGSVTINIQFKDAQVSELGAESGEDVTIIHMPLVEDVKEAADSTLEADASVADIQIEVVADNTNVNGNVDTTTITLDNFSVVAVTSGSSSYRPGTTRTFADVLGEAKNIGLVANSITLAGHLETNMATKDLKGNNGPWAGPRNSGFAGASYIGDFTGSNGVLIDGGNAGVGRGDQYIYTTKDAAGKFGSNTCIIHSDGSVEYKRSGFQLDFSMSQNDINNYVDYLIGTVRSNSEACFNEPTAFDYSLVKNSGTIDIRGKGAGTYYINFDAGEFATLKNIYMDSNQNVILNIPDTSVSFPQMGYIIGSLSGSTQGAENEDIVAQKIIYNCPNATYAHSTGPTTGTFLVPDATYDNDSVAAGWLVANKITKVGGQEWHNVYHDMPDPAGLKLGVTKYYVDQNGQAISWNGKTFTFQIKQKNGSQYPTQTVVATESNKSPYFSGYTFGPYSDSNNHTYTFEVSEINKTDSDVEYDNTVYTVTVVARTYNNRTTVTATYMNGNTTVNKMTFTNKEKVKTTEATIKKIWNDSDDADGLRPASLTVRLKNGNTTVKEVVLNEGNNWSYTVKDLPILSYGEYKWEEVDLPSGYELTNTDKNGTITSLTNTHTPSKVDVKVIKVWKDSDNQDGIRPTSIDVDLLANGVKKTTVTLNDKNNWSATVENLPKISGGKTITYSWKEITVEGYTVTTSKDSTGYVTTLTNTHTPSKVDVKVIKVWKDNDNQDGIRPTSINVNLLANGVKKTTVTLNSGNNWSATVEDLPKTSGGKAITYTWEEITVEGYTVTTSKDSTGYVTTLTNTHTPEVTEREVIKVWNDADNQDGKRPASLKVILLADNVDTGKYVTLNANNKWDAKLTDLPKYANGKEIKYTWSEVGLSSEYTLTNTETKGTITTLTNSYQTKTTERTVKKVWNDDDNRDGIRPASLTVKLMNGTTEVGEVTLNEENSWTATIKNLPVYNNGTLIEYTWSEGTLPTGYTLTNTKTEGTITTLTNTYNSKKTEATVKKVWVDGNNQDGKRPTSIDVDLLANGSVIETVTLSDANSWTTTIYELPVNENGKAITYTWAENEESLKKIGYTLTNKDVTGTVTTLTNTYKPQETERSVKKVWDDANNQDGKRPGSITVVLSGDNGYSKEVILSDANSWEATVSGLPVNKNGKAITYTWTEDEESVEKNGYKLTNTATEGLVTTFTNSYTPEETEREVVKVWDDANNQDGKRPTELKVDLMAGNEVVKTVTLNDGNKWTAKVEHLPVYKNGVAISYSWSEGELPTGYKLSNSETKGTITTLTNSYIPGKTTATVKKIWNDADNQDGMRPEELKVNLLADGKVKETVTLNADNNWEYTVSGLAEKASGKDINYTWEEVSVPSGYTLEGTTKNGTITSITNKHVPDLTDKTVLKVWKDSDNQDGKRPESLTVELKANGSTIKTVILNDANKWTATVENLPVYKNGHKITYAWSEETLPTGYSLESSETVGTITTITNGYTPETTTRRVVKVWDDNYDQDGLRPESLSVDLKADGVVIKTVTLNDDNNWAETVKDLPVYADGKKITYAWSEKLPEGYTLTVGTDEKGIITTLTNKHVPDVTKRIVKKVWEDNSNQDGMRPESLTVALNGSDGSSRKVVLSADNGWMGTLNNLPVKSHGNDITYTWVEVDLPKEYELTKTEVDGLITTLTNTHVPDLTDRTVIKVWDDKDNQDGKRPTTLAVLFTGGTTTEKVVLSESNDWTYTIKNLPVYENGKKIEYKWVEASIDGYSLTTEVDGTGKITTLTNHYTPGKTSATIEKIWDDKDDQDGVRPEELKVDLLADGKVVKTVTLNEANGWTATVADLDKMAAGKEIKYTWSEKDLSEDYTLGGSSTEGFITSITNVHVPEETDRTVKKVWNDNNDQDGKRPANLNVVLMADGEVYKSVVLNADNNWSYTAEKLPVYAAGKQITYTWAEDEDGLPEGYELTDTKTSGKITTFTNSYKPEETDRTVVKVWDDNDNQDGKRPVSLDVVLKADGKTVKTVTLNADNNWSATVNKLPVYADGKKITYTWAEDEDSIAPTYELTDVAVSEDGKVTTLTNTHKPEETEAIVVKVWNDGSNQDGKRPTELTVNLLANGEIIQTVVLKAEEWTTTISKLPVYANGKKIAYTWTEDEAGLPEGYVLISNETNGKITTITNGHTPENTYATVKKVWDDANDQDHKRPEELKVDLKADGEVVATVTLNADNKWKATVEDLPVYSNGKVIEYTWAEDELPEGYVLSDTSVDGKITTLTNSYKPEETVATVKKVWEDKNDQDGKRPASLEVVLKADGVKKTTVTLNADNDWSATVEGLPVYDDGNAIVYTWAENEAGLPEGYELTDTSINGTVTTLTNTYKPEETSATVIKAWADKDNQDGKRPAELKVVLKGNGKEIKTVTLTADTNWTAKVEELPMYENGKKIDYTWAEDEDGLPEGYELDGSTKDGTVTTITNKYTPEETERTVKKVWDDADNQDGKRLESLSVLLKGSDGSERKVTLSDANSWTDTITGLPVYDKGIKITYTWYEGELPEGYVLSNTEENGTITTLTNSYVPGETAATIVKIWNDADDQDGKRPEDLTVNLLADGKVIETVTLNKDNNWTVTVSGLDEMAAGKKIVYTWAEDEAGLPEGYELTDTSVNGTVTTLTNSYTPEVTERTVIKVWDDKDDQDGKRPETLDVFLKGTDESVRKATLSDDNDWTATFKKLPVYANGVKITYTWYEDELPEGYVLSNTEENGTITTLTNSYTPGETAATIIKIWDDAANQDGKRPEELKVDLLANGKVNQSVTLNEGNSWTVTITGLPEKKFGKTITYTWAEDEDGLPEGYELTNTEINGTVTTLTNSYVPSETEVTVKKVWNDANNQDGKRPEELKVDLLADGTVIDTVTLTEDNSWTASVKGLPQKAAGKDIVYTWAEDEDGLPEGYEFESTSKNGSITTITNKYTPEETERTVLKVWDDAENQDGKRPESLSVLLKGTDGSERKVILSDENSWTDTITGLPAYANGVKIVYTWYEGALPEGYVMTNSEETGTITTITNSYVPGETAATIVKIWDDADDQDGKRPEDLTVNLLADGKVIETVTLNKDNNWTVTVSGLDEMAAGKKIVYTWAEDEAGLPEGYKLTDTSVNGTVTTLTNSYTPEVTERTVIKVWDDKDDQDGKRPESLEVVLKGTDGSERKATLSDANDWTATFKKLPVYAEGSEIKYTWYEGELPEGYVLSNTEENGTITTLTNSYTPGETAATIIKIWSDKDDQDGKRPEELKVNLLANGKVNQTVTLNEGNSWTVTITGLPEKKFGKTITYTWAEDEDGLPEGYELTNTDINGTVTTLTNSYVPSETEATVKKVWDDKNNQDGKRPEELKVDLKADGTVINTVTLNADNNWTVTVTGLAEKAAGKDIDYTWAEDEDGLPEGYKLSGVAKAGTITTITNKYVPQETERTVLKVWDDADNQDGKRPESLSVLLKGTDGSERTVTLSDENSWTDTITGLPVYADGAEIKYTWYEGALPEGYVLTNTEEAGTITTLTNSYTPGKTAATIIKVWDDKDNQDGVRPEELKVDLLADGKVIETVTLNADNKWTATVADLDEMAAGKKIVYTWAEDEAGLPEGYKLTDTSVNGTVTTLTNSRTPEETDKTVEKVWDDKDNQDGKRPESLSVVLKGTDGSENAVTLNEDNGWTATVKNLPVYAEGAKITYTWYEGELPEGYVLTNTEEKGTITTLTNSYTPGETAATIVKIWADADNQDGKRPEELKVDLLSNGKVIETVTLNADNNWSVTVTGLPEKAAGRVIKYTWAEDEDGLPEGYVLSDTSVNGTVTTITNSYVPTETYATVKKVWDDAGNQDHKRPEELKVDLLADGVVVDTVTLNADNKWTATVTGLPEKAAGKLIKYTWAEDEAGLPEGYALTNTSVNGYITTLTNTYAPETTEATIVKIWDDKDNQDGKRPETLMANLKANGNIIVTVTLSESNGWTAKVEDLPVYEDGNKITYTWAENEAGLPVGYELTDTSIDGTITSLTNTYMPEETTATVVKVWADKDDQDAKRPESLTVELKANDKVVKTVTLDATNGWSYKVEGLPMYENGKKIDYTWAEDETGLPEGYKLESVEKDGTVTTITNSYKPEETERTVVKVWDDKKDQDGNRPASLNVMLKGDDGSERVVTLDANNEWTQSVTGLPKYNKGVEIKYYWIEAALPEGYVLTNTEEKGIITTITNSYVPGETAATVLKVWADKNNQDAKRPAELKVDLLADGVKKETVTLNEANNWTATVTGLDEKAAGKVINYTWAEDEAGLPEGYTLTSTEKNGTVTTLTNTYTPETVEVPGKKTWVDNDDEYDLRPTSITIRLYADGVEIDVKKVTAADGWTWTFTDLPKYKDGVEIVYTVAEDLIPGYTTLQDGYNFTNTITTVKVSKVDITNEEEVPGALLQIFDKNGNKIEQWISTETPHEIYGLKVGETYTLREKTAPEGYTVVTADTTFVVNSDGSVTATGSKVEDGVILVADAPTKVSVSKVDITDQKELPGAHIQIIDNEGNVVTEWDSTGTPHEITGLKTNVTYTLHETIAPDGFTIAADTTFVIDEKGNVTSSGTVTEEGVVLVEDWPTKIYVSKVDITNQKEVAGAHIQIIDAKGKVVEEWNSDGTPHEITGLNTNETYTLHETIAPDGFTIAADTTFVIDENGNVTSTGTVTQDGIILVEDAPTKIHVSKVDITNQEELPGAHIQILDKDGKVVVEWTSTDTPQEIEGLKTNETYTLHEIIAPDGFTIAADTTFVIDEKGNVTSSGTVTEEGIVLVEDWPTSVKISKVDVTNQKEVAGAHIQIIDKNGKVVVEWISTETPYEIIGLKTNETYTLHETIAPDGFTIAADTTFVIDENGKVTSSGTVTEEGIVLVEDAPTKVHVSKVDITNQKELPGAHIQIIDKDGNVVEEWNSTETPHEITGLKTNETYTLRETVAPDGYTIAADTTFVIDENGNVTSSGTVTEEGIVLVEDWPTTVKVSKVDITDQKEVAGAHIQIIDKDGKVVEEWNSTETPHEVVGLKINEEYTLRETVAPLGYEIATDTKFSINPDGSVNRISGSITEDGIILVEDDLTYIAINGQKYWDDADNQDGKRPLTIVIRLYADDKEIRNVTVSEKEDWKWSFTKLPEYNKGKKITYKITEDYIPEYESEVKGYDVTNKYTPKTTQVSGAKSWEDADNQDGKRPATIVVNLLADGTKIDSKKVTKDDNWQWNWTGLPMYKNGQVIKYTVTEDVVEYYETEVDGFNIKNTHVPETVDVPGKKTWVDEDDKDGLRPTSITINLWKKVGKTEAVKIDSKKVTKDDNWSWKWTALPKYEKGELITYSVTEDEIKHYETEVKGYDVTNTHKVENVDVFVKKVWVDSDDFYDMRPESITVHLFANDKEVAKTTIKPDDNGDWKCAWYGLPKYEKGKLIEYKVTEDVVPGYNTDIVNENDVENNRVDCTITNKYSKPSDDPSFITISGEKTWDDGNDQDGKRPASIKIKLTATVDGKEVEVLDKDRKAVTTTVTVKADASGKWTYAWKDLMKFKSGKEIKYSITEEEVKYYETAYDGYNIKNTHKPETTTVEGKKTWDDSNNLDGKRTTSITIRLLADGKEVKNTTVTEKSGWKWSFTDLPKYANGKEIKYTITEDAVKDYTTTVKGYDVTNTHKPETVSISGTKTWNDQNDKDKIRPTSIEVYLLANGKVTQTITVTASNSWKYSFTNLPKYSNGTEIKYTIAEKPVTGYTGVISGYNITNTHTPTTPNTPTTPPNTGDSSDLAGLMGMMMASLAGMAALIFARKKEEEAE